MNQTNTAILKALNQRNEFTTVGNIDEKAYMRPYRRYTMQEADMMVRRYVPIQLILTSTYYPMAMGWLLYNITERVCDSLADNRVEPLKRKVRDIRTLNREFQKVMYSEDAAQVDRFRAFYEQWYDNCVLPMLGTWVTSYQQLVLRTTAHHGNASQLVALLEIAYDVADYCERYDIDVSNQISALLRPVGMGYEVNGDRYSTEQKRYTAALLQSLGASETLHDQNTDNALKIFIKQLKEIELEVNLDDPTGVLAVAGWGGVKETKKQ